MIENLKAKIFGYILGDGWLDIRMGCGVAGDFDSLPNIANDIFKKYGFDFSQNIVTKETYSPKYNIKGTTSSFHTNIKFARIMHDLGMPKGKRTEAVYELPAWIINGSIETKASFLSGFYAAEGYIPSMQINDKTPKPLSFCFYKSYELKENAKLLKEQFISLLEDLKLKCSAKTSIRYTNKKVLVTTISISNEKSNFLKALNLLRLNYCIKKENRRQSILKYFDSYATRLNEIRTRNKAILELKGKKTFKEMAELFNMTSRQVEKVCNGRSSGRVLKDFPTYSTYCSTKTPLNGRTLSETIPC